MASTKRKANRKKRISKHVLEFRKIKLANQNLNEDEQQQQSSTTTEDVNEGTTTIIKQGDGSKKNKGFTIDPNFYLSSWWKMRQQQKQDKDEVDNVDKNDTSPTSSPDKTTPTTTTTTTPITPTTSTTQIWKFNKNTQAWLLQHMYEPLTIRKESFTILLKYLHGLNGASIKKRVKEGAEFRITRYRNFEKENKEDNKSGDGVEDDEKKNAKEKESGDDGGEDKKTGDEENKEVPPITDDQEEVLKKWNLLDDSMKRKEYKRAFQVYKIFTSGDSGDGERE